MQQFINGTETIVNFKLLQDDLLDLFASQDTDAVFRAGTFVDSLAKSLQLIGIQLAAGPPSGTVLEAFQPFLIVGINPLLNTAATVAQ